MINNYMNTNKKSPIGDFAKATTSVSNKSIGAMIANFDSDTNQRSVKIERSTVIKALKNRFTNTTDIRNISREFYSINPIYTRLCQYLSDMLCFYWVVTPSYLKVIDTNDEKQLIKDWFEVLNYVENINPEGLGRSLLLDVIVDGESYIAIKENNPKKATRTFGVQKLPFECCRSIKELNGRSVVEINLEYFEKMKATELAKIKVAYPDYIVKLIETSSSKPRQDNGKWVILDPNYTFHFSLKKDNLPFFIGVILDLLDLQDTKDINMYKLEQELSKILIHKFPLGEDNNPVLDDQEMINAHQTVVNLLQGVPGIELIPTIAEIKDIDLSGNIQSQGNDNLARQYKNVFSNAGISENLMNADNAGSLAKSLILDFTLVYKFLNNFNEFLKIKINSVFGINDYTIFMPPVTFFNQEEKAATYFKQSDKGYSKFLPAICLGQRQSYILSSALFESQCLQMQSLMVPNASANTMSSSQNTENLSGNTKKEEERSEKTELNRESLEGE